MKGLPDAGFFDALVELADDGGAADVGAADVGAADVSAADVGAAEMGAADVGAADVGASEVGASEVGADDDSVVNELDDDVEPAGLLVDGLEVDVALLEQADSATQARLATASPRKAIGGIMTSESHAVELASNHALVSRRPRAAITSQ